MAFSFTNLQYGWIYLTGLIVTGSTIFVLNNTKKYVEPVDVIQIALGATEHALATQYATNPTAQYRVAPPSIVSSWVNTNGVSEDVTNAIGPYISKAMLDNLDDTIVALVPYYGMSNSPGDAWTVTGLWASLGIGNKTNLFTSIPCWTNRQTNYPILYTNYFPTTSSPITVSVTSLYPETVHYAYSFTSNSFLWTNRVFNTPVTLITTNIATYGDYVQYIYVEALQERYKVLNTLEYMIDQNKTTVSNYYFTTFWPGAGLRKYTYTNSEVPPSQGVGYGSVVDIDKPLQKAYIDHLGYSPFYTNFYDETYPGYPWYLSSDEAMEVTWSMISSWASVYWADWFCSSNTTDNLYFYYQAGKYSRNALNTNSFDFTARIYKSAATFKWANYHYTNIPSTFGVYYSGATTTKDAQGVESATNTVWELPRSWTLTYLCLFEEGLTEGNLYKKIDDSFITTEGENNVLNMGWDEFAYKGAVPPPTLCSEPTGSDYTNNLDAVGYSLGMTIPVANFKGVRKYQFSYCTNRWW